jgi:hypothetical protein
MNRKRPSPGFGYQKGDWVIITDARKGGGVLMYANRDRQRKFWWTKSSTYAMVWNDYDRAEEFCNNLRYNKPRVVPLIAALRLNHC